MKFEWDEFIGDLYLGVGDYYIARIYKYGGCFKLATVFHIFGIDTNKEYPDLETAKKAVEEQIHNFCVEFNIWYMR